MSFTLLQVDAAQQASNSLLNYGAIGAILVIALIALAFIFRLYSNQMQAQIDALKKDLAQEKELREGLEKKFQEYLTNEREESLKIISACEVALKQNSEALLQVAKKL